ncbi:MAG: carbonic anhydrase [Saprospiraceae bacterium]
MSVKNLSWEEALKRLKEGNARFGEDKLDGKLQNSNRRKELKDGQQPYAIILSCADSRVVPELTFDTGLGEIFVIRVAGNVANLESIASIEYAVAHLGVNLIVVLGHESCGAVTAAIAGGDNGYNLNLLLAHIQPAIAATEGGDVNSVVKKNAVLTAEDLTDRSKIIRDAAAKEDGLKILSGYYNLKSGVVDYL